MRIFAVILVLVTLMYSGCASIATTVANSIEDSITCHHKCPGGSPEAEKKCYDECVRRLSARREQSCREREEAEKTRQDYEFRRQVENQFRSQGQGYRGGGLFH
ncbi:MAG: hypothetical protein V2B18_04235 [Pseudomonadota bacterium]